MSISFPGIGLTLDYVARSVRIFGWEVSFYGILVAMGMILALACIVLEAKRSQEDPNHYLGAMLGALVLGTAGARLLYLVSYPSLFQEDPSRILALRNGGLAFYGALFGGYLAVRLTATLTRSPAGKMLDICAPALLLAQAVGRFGDFFNREGFGEYTTWITRMRLPLEAVSSGEVTSLMRENLLVSGERSYILVHPCFLYEVVWCLFLLILLVARKRKKLFEGEIFLRYLAGYSLGRGVIEYLRTDQMPVPFVSMKLPLNLLLSILLFVFSCLALLVRRSMAKKRRAYRRARREAAYELRRKKEREEAEEEEEDVFALLADLEEERRRESLSQEEAPRSVVEEVQQAASHITPRRTGPEEPIPGDLSSFDMEQMDREVEEGLASPALEEAAEESPAFAEPAPEEVPEAAEAEEEPALEPEEEPAPEPVSMEELRHTMAVLEGEEEPEEEESASAEEVPGETEEPEEAVQEQPREENAVEDDEDGFLA